MVESKAAGFNPDTVVVDWLPEEHADNKVAAMPNPKQDNFRFFISQNFF